MRRAVFGWWQMPEEEAEFLDFLDSTGTVVAYHEHRVKTEAEITPFPVRSYLAENNPAGVVLGLGPHTADVIINCLEKDKEKFFGVDLMKSCLIGYSRPRFRNGNQLGKSNLAAYLDFLKDGALQPKPDWFLSWVKQVISWAKKRAKKKCVHQGFYYPTTPLVLKLVEEKQIEAVH
jgi:hypothetical protein